MKSLSYHCFLLSILFVSAGRCIAQPEQSQFRLITRENGLSDNHITGIVQDEKGFIWISTSNGLNRFDGVHFSVFYADKSADAIPDNTISVMHYFNKGCLAIATSAGVQLINTNNHLKRANLVVPTDTLLYYWSNSARDITKLPGGFFLVGTKTGLFVFDGTGKLQQRYDQYTLDDVGKAWMIFIARNNLLPDSSVLVQAENGFIHYDPATKKFARINAAPAGLGRLAADYKKSTMFFQRLHDENFLYTDKPANDLVVYNYKTNHEFRLHLPFELVTEIGWSSKVSPLTDSTWAITGYHKGFFILTHHRNKDAYSLSPKYFSNHPCSYIFSDRNSRLWIGTMEGLFMQKSIAPNAETVQLDKLELNDRVYLVSDIISWKSDLYVASLHSGDVLVLDKHTMKLKQVISLSKKYPAIGSVFSFLQIHPDTIWAGTDRGLYWLHPASSHIGKINNPSYPAALDSINIFRWLKDSRGHYWFVTENVNTVLLYDTGQKKFRLINADQSDPLFKINVAFSIAEDKKGQIWISGDGLCRLNSSTYRCDTLIKYFKDFNPFQPAMAVLNAGNDQSVWISSNGNGLLQWNPYTGKQTYFLTDRGTYTNQTRYIISAGNQIAFLHSNGLSIFDINTQSSQSYSSEEGLANPLTYYFLRYDSSGQCIYATGLNTISRIHMQTGPAQSVSPSLVITSLQTSNDSIIHYPGKEVYLYHYQNDISIRFAAISYSAATNLRYVYAILTTGEPHWIELGNQGMINFNNLPPGTYHILVKAYSANNEWREVIQPIIIHISAPWWQQAWFKVSSLAGVIILLAFLYRTRIAQIRRKGEINQRLAEYEIKALHAQMNPHFIFNCLNSIKFMIIQGEQNQASLYLTRFSRMIRQTLEQSKQGMVTIQKEKEYLTDYLEMEKLRYKHSFEYSILVSDINPETTLIPAMLIQPIAENAIWHGLMHKAGEKNLSICFNKEEGKIICRIKDNGVGFSTTPGLHKTDHRSTGLDNIRKRIHLLNQKFNTSFLIHINRNNGTGTGACIELVFDDGFDIR